MTEPDLDRLITPEDWERAAQAALDPAAHAYIAGGATDEITLRDNRAAWSRYALRPRALVGVGHRDPGVELLGRPRPHPVIIAPTAYHRLAHPDGEPATARAAAATSTVMCLSTLATSSPEEVAAAAPDATRWFQLYVFKDRGVTREIVTRAAHCGYEALVVTVDLTLFGRRERELRTGDAETPPSQVANAAQAGVQGHATPASLQDLVDPELRWSDLELFAAESGLPVLVKGVLRPEDARRAVEHGAAGVIVSNHGGRQLDSVLSGADALADIADEVGDELDVIVDGGVRRGTDVIKALSLGARAVMIGRPVVYGLAVAGETGVRRVIETLLSEIDNALGLVGCPQARALDASFVTHAPWAR
ncbi:MAG TPA: alpha-hydroxy acid oxidase [Solirubrobacteraceae bacterium]|nr:alpha-hydroxy acid oxidase [Solirubrobacteraceae bacterium]